MSVPCADPLASACTEIPAMFTVIETGRCKGLVAVPFGDWHRLSQNRACSWSRVVVLFIHRWCILLSFAEGFR